MLLHLINAIAFDNKSNPINTIGKNRYKKVIFLNSMKKYTTNVTKSDNINNVLLIMMLLKINVSKTVKAVKNDNFPFDLTLKYDNKKLVIQKSSITVATKSSIIMIIRTPYILLEDFLDIFCQHYVLFHPTLTLYLS